MAPMLPLLALACTSSGPDGPPSLHATLTVDAEAGTFATVTWTTEEAADGRLEFGDDTSYGASLEATESEDGMEHTVRWFGTPAGAEPHWRVVSEGASGPMWSPDEVYDAPPPPTVFPSLDGEVDPSAEAGFVLTSMLPRPSAAVILDGDNRPVWWKLLEDGRVIMQTRLSADGTAVLILDTAADYLDDDTVLHRVPLDGSPASELRLPHGHHDFVELDDGRVLFLAVDIQPLDGADVAGDALVAMDEAGNTETMWSAWESVPTGTIEPKLLYPGNFVDWTHCNGFAIDPSTGEYWVSAHNLSGVLVIDPVTRGVRWQIGGTLSNVTIEGGGFDQQHSPALVDGGFLIFDNGPSEAETLRSAVREFTFDAETSKATRVWSYEDPDGLYASFFGNAERLEGGNTLVSWGAAGRIAEVTPDGATVRRLDVGIGTALGYVHALGAGFTVR